MNCIVVKGVEKKFTVLLIINKARRKYPPGFYYQSYYPYNNTKK